MCSAISADAKLYTHMHVCVCMRVCMLVCVCMCMCVCLSLSLMLYERSFIASTSLRLCTVPLVPTPSCTCLCMCVCMCVCVRMYPSHVVRQILIASTCLRSCTVPSVPTPSTDPSYPKAINPPVIGTPMYVCVCVTWLIHGKTHSCRDSLVLGLMCAMTHPLHDSFKTWLILIIIAQGDQPPHFM